MPALSAVLFWIVAAADTSRGALRLQVIDAMNDEPLPGVVVSLPDLARTGVTDARGRVVFPGVAAGPQHVSVRRLGYRPATLHAFVGGAGTLDLVIALDRVAERLGTVRVDAEPVVAVRDDVPASDVVGARVLSRTAVQLHPLLSEPDPLLAAVGGHVGTRPEASGGLHLMGGQSDHVSYRLDGLPILSPFHAGGLLSAINPDAVDRVVVETAPRASYATDALGGTVLTTTRAAPRELRWSSGLSVTHSRLTVEAPLPRAGSGLLASARLLTPGLLGQAREAAQLDADAGDLLLRLVSPVHGGTLRLLGFSARNDVSVSSRVVDGDEDPSPPQSEMAWHASTLGATWERSGERGRLSLAAWHAAGNAEATWLGDSSAPVVAWRLAERGVEIGGMRLTRGQGLSLGLRMVERRSPYTGETRGTVGLQRDGAPSLLVTLSPHWSLALGGGHSVAVGAAASWHGANQYSAPHVSWTWRPTSRLAVLTTASRHYQFMQSLRNPESPVAYVFPAELSVTAGAGIPAARSDQVTSTLEWRQTTGSVVQLRAWSRRLSGLALAAIGNGAPMASALPAVGDGRVTGLSIDLSATGARWGFVGSYGAQRVRFSARDTTWQPEHGTAHSLDAGMVVFPHPTASLRLGVGAGAGRRASTFAGPFEWEACNLRDRGCEFAGAPLQRTDPLGRAVLPRYLRADVGVRKHWHLTAAGRDMLVAAFATWTNLFDRSNLLTVVRDPVLGAGRPVTMRPSAPLVLGLDWRF